jgi:PEP-CTERM motif-containing protein
MKHHKNTSRLAKFVGLTGLIAGILASVGTVSAGTFINGGFEDNNLGSWQRGSGYWTGGLAGLTTANYSPGGPNYDASYDQSAIVGVGTDANTGGALNTVYSGNYSARVNNNVNDYSVSLIKQTVANYTDQYIFFAWAAVLEDSHGVTDSDNFRLTLTNDTTSTILYDVTYNSANTPAGLFNSFGSWNYTQWQVQQLDVSAFSGDTFTLSLLASDCPYGGHAGYVYLDGFGAVVPVQTGADGAVPEPSTYGLMGAAALLGAVMYRRRFGKKPVAQV